MGAWLSYGLGSENENLPAFVVMTSVSKGTTCGQIFYDFYWGSGFLPGEFQGHVQHGQAVEPHPGGGVGNDRTADANVAVMDGNCSRPLAPAQGSGVVASLDGRARIG